MRGVIKNFIESKGYGFIAGENGKDYFFHINEVKERLKQISDGLPVQFEEAVSPKGYSAKQIHLLDDKLLYEQPESVLTSKKDSVKGWSIVERGKYSLSYSSSNSPDEAKDGLKSIARAMGITGFINLRYFKTTGSSGNYNYTIHNFEGLPVSLARKGLAGGIPIENIPRFGAALEGYIQNIAEENAFQQRLRSFRWKLFLAAAAILFCICVLFLKNLGLFLGFVVVCALYVWVTPFVGYMLRRIESKKALKAEIDRVAGVD